MNVNAFFLSFSKNIVWGKYWNKHRKYNRPCDQDWNPVLPLSSRLYLWQAMSWASVKVWGVCYIHTELVLWGVMESIPNWKLGHLGSSPDHSCCKFSCVHFNKFKCSLINSCWKTNNQASFIVYDVDKLHLTELTFNCI